VNNSNRGGRGRFVGSEDAQKRHAEAVKMRLTGMSFDRIAEALGYADAATAYNAVKRELENAPREDVRALRELEAQRLDGYTEILIGVLRANHVMVSVTRGQVILDPDTDEALLDYGPVMDAVRELRQISESRRRLFGLDPRQPVEMHVTVTEVSQADLEFRDMVNEERARRATARATAQSSDA
jgi:hypothetical protein